MLRSLLGDRDYEEHGIKTWGLIEIYFTYTTFRFDFWERLKSLNDFLDGKIAVGLDINDMPRSAPHGSVYNLNDII